MAVAQRPARSRAAPPRRRAAPAPFADDVAAVARTSADDLDELCANWRTALDTAQRALDCGSRLLPSGETVRRGAALRAERTATARMLDRLARERQVEAWTSDLQVPAWHLRRILSLTPGIAACVFTLDGVLIGSASLHAAAWNATFGPFLAARVERTGGRFDGFDAQRDYFTYLHARPRLDGVRAFLASRGIRLPEGGAADAPGSESVHGLANRKRDVLIRLLDAQGVRAFAGSRRYLQLAGAVGLQRAVVSASANTPSVLERAHLVEVVDASIDGNVMATESLRAKPAPDTLLAACRALDVEPARAAAFETTPDGVAAALAAGFGLVVGIGDEASCRALHAAGATIVASSLGELLERRLATAA
jgi:beta-phosphoglucomutase-like phosphatase (HAD superfamily)